LTNKLKAGVKLPAQLKAVAALPCEK